MDWRCHGASVDGVDVSIGRQQVLLRIVSIESAAAR
jgi:hypothetical protein